MCGRSNWYNCEVKEETKNTSVKSYNVGQSDYSKHKIQPWDIWIEYKLDPFRADIVKRILRNKTKEDRILDLKKIIHICEYLLEIEGKND